MLTLIRYSLLLGIVICTATYFSGCTNAIAIHNNLLADTSVTTEPNTDNIIRPWKPISGTVILPCRVAIKKNKFKQYNLNYNMLKANLLNAPDEKKKGSANKLIIDLPYPDGSFQQFSITKSNIMPDDLAAKYPELNAYSGINTLQAAESVRCECTGEGFKAMITTLKGMVLISNCNKKDSLIYLTYYKSDLINPKKKKFEKTSVNKQ